MLIGRFHHVIIGINTNENVIVDVKKSWRVKANIHMYRYMYLFQ